MKLFQEFLYNIWHSEIAKFPRRTPRIRFVIFKFVDLHYTSLSRWVKLSMSASVLHWFFSHKVFYKYMKKKPLDFCLYIRHYKETISIHLLNSLNNSQFQATGFFFFLWDTIIHNRRCGITYILVWTFSVLGKKKILLSRINQIYTLIIRNFDRWKLIFLNLVYLV